MSFLINKFFNFFSSSPKLNQTDVDKVISDLQIARKIFEDKIFDFNYYITCMAGSKLAIKYIKDSFSNIDENDLNLANQIILKDPCFLIILSCNNINIELKNLLIKKLIVIYRKKKYLPNMQ